MKPESEGVAPGTWFRQFIEKELLPYPGRGAVAARMTLAAVITTLLIMTFRIPGGTLGALSAFLISRDSWQATLRSALGALLTYAVGLLLLLLGASLFSDVPFTSFLWYTGTLLLVFFVLRTLRDFATATAFAVITVNVLPVWQSRTTAGDRVEQTLWLALAVALGVVVTVAVEAIFRAFDQSDPVQYGLVDRWRIVESVLGSIAGGHEPSSSQREALAKYALAGVGTITRHLVRSYPDQQRKDRIQTLAALTGRVVDFSAAFVAERAMLPQQELSESERTRTERLRSVVHLVGGALAAGAPLESKWEIEEAPSPPDAPVLAELEHAVSTVTRFLAGGTESTVPYTESDGAGDGWRLFVRDAFSNPEHLQFTVRCWGAASTCYVILNLAAWPGLSSSITTCVFTALSTVGSARQKQFLRVIGTVLGGVVCGLGSQIFVLPYIDSITGFILLIAAVTFISAWIATSSPKLSYVGVQLALAFYLINLQEFTIQTSLALSRDRVVGVLLGLSAMWIAFEGPWGRTAHDEMLHLFAATLRLLSDLASLPAKAGGAPLIKQIRALRETIAGNFQAVSGQADAVFFDFGPRRDERLRRRDTVRYHLAFLRTYYLMQIALLQYAAFRAETPREVRTVVIELGRECASALNEMAASWEQGSGAVSTTRLRVRLSELQEQFGADGIPAATRAELLGVWELSLQAIALLEKLSREIPDSAYVSSEAAMIQTKMS